MISRKDLPNLYLNHVLHSLSLAKVIPFAAGETVLDLGTGGGFPGIPLAILFPDVLFTLLDATGKKIMVVNSIAGDLGLSNLRAVHARAEHYRGQFNYVLSRAVCSFSRLVELSAGKLIKSRQVKSAHGIYSLKGGDLKTELAGWEGKVEIFQIGKIFREEYFLTKSIVFLPVSNTG